LSDFNFYLANNSFLGRKRRAPSSLFVAFESDQVSETYKPKNNVAAYKMFPSDLAYVTARCGADAETGTIKSEPKSRNVRYITHSQTIPYLAELSRRLFSSVKESEEVDFESRELKLESVVPQRQVSICYSAYKLDVAKLFRQMLGSESVPDFSNSLVPAFSGLLFGSRLSGIATLITNGGDMRSECRSFALSCISLALSLKPLAENKGIYKGDLWDFISPLVPRYPAAIQRAFSISEVFCEEMGITAFSHRIAVFSFRVHTLGLIFNCIGQGFFELNTFNICNAPYDNISARYFYRMLHSCSSSPSQLYLINH